MVWHIGALEGKTADFPSVFDEYSIPTDQRKVRLVSLGSGTLGTSCQNQFRFFIKRSSEVLRENQDCFTQEKLDGMESDKT